MIARIHGVLVTINPPQIIIDANGIGYELDMPLSDCVNLPQLGSQCIIYTHLVIREDAHDLYGFLSIEKCTCFKKLIKIPGIGAKIALAILSTLSLQELEHSINLKDAEILRRVPGIGKKMAERMLFELSGYIVPLDATISLTLHDIATALSNLGYKPPIINKVIQQLPSDIDIASGIKQALHIINGMSL